MAEADIGVIGLGVMGRNLVLNMDDHGIAVAVYNRTTERVDEFLTGEAAGRRVIGVHSLEELVQALEPPRRVMLMVSAGKAVDAVIEQLQGLLSEGDIIIDGGNSQHTDTMRRTDELAGKSLRFIGTGISGGEEGARHGPSIMPGGDESAWPAVEPIFKAIAARAEDGEPCAAWLGPDGAGHYVKMVHNGIEYADMQLIAEAYDLLRRGAGLETREIQPVFAEWNQGKLGSFLMEITADILGFEQDGSPLVEQILGVAEQKGTGKWTVVSSMQTGVPASTIAAAVYGRIVSAFPSERKQAATSYDMPVMALEARRDEVLADLHDALYASKLIAYAQGFKLMQETSGENGWDLSLETVARIWRAGCIIRSRILQDIIEAYRTDARLANLMLAPGIVAEIRAAEPGWRRTVVRGIEAGVPLPGFSAALSYFDTYRSEHLPANLIQAQRDYFGAHTYERIDEPRGRYYHTDWAGKRQDGAAARAGLGRREAEALDFICLK